MFGLSRFRQLSLFIMLSVVTPQAQGKKPKPYNFVTTWQLKATQNDLWVVINDSKQWPEWWKNIKRVEEKNVGGANGIGNIRAYTIKSPIGYKLRFDLELTRRDIDSLLVGEASGDLLGTGTWEFKETDSTTIITCRWDVYTTRGWMNTFRFVLAPILKWNHDLVMKKGAKGLAKKMNCELIDH